MSSLHKNSESDPGKREKMLRSLPKVDDCLFHLLDTDIFPVPPPRLLVKEAVRDILDEYRTLILSGKQIQDSQFERKIILKKMSDRIFAMMAPRLKRIINASGVIIHTNLGRSILPDQTMEMLVQAGGNYSNLEYDLQTGKRGSRYSLVEDLLCRLTGAEAALVVNNNAAAVLIVLETLAKGREAIVSRGQLVEIGGSFRIPDVMERSGAKLREVGATNRTHLRDYERAICEETALLLKVHASNYRIIGFTKEVSMEQLVGLGKKHGLPVVEDLGSGCFIDLSQFGLMKEPTVQEVVSAGVDVVTFSGDKLLGGPQAGIILGKKNIIARIKKNPLNRALRIDKFTLAGLESVLRLYYDEAKAIQTIPTLAMIAISKQEIKQRAEILAQHLRKPLGNFCKVTITDTFSRVGGGAMPEQNLASQAVCLKPHLKKINDLELQLRQLDIPIIGRIENDSFLLDMRTVKDNEIPIIADSLKDIFLSPVTTS